MKKITKIAAIVITLLLTIYFFTTASYANSDVSVYSENYILIEASTGKIVCGNNYDTVLYPASTTKIMTAILTLENCDLKDKAVVSHNAIFSVPLGYSHAMLVEGEELTIEQLLNLLLIPSANDAAIVLAEHIAGSVDSFSTMMNTKAIELGCTNTNFVNPNGIHDDNHYSTAHDLAIMAKYAMQNETFRRIVTTKEYTLPATNNYPEPDRYFENTNALVVPDDRDSYDNYYYPYATGVKTGYTDPAGECLVASAKKDDKEYIVAILDSGRTENGLSQRFLDSKKLFEYAFENYSLTTLNESHSLLKEIEISNASILNNKLDILIQDKLDVLVKKNQDLTAIVPTIEYTADLSAPIKKDSVIGKITYTIGNNTYTSNLIAGEDMHESNFITSVLTIGSIIVIVFLIYKLMKFNTKKKKSKKKKDNRTDYMYW